MVRPRIRTGGMRGLIARKMHESQHEAAQLTFTCDCNAGELMRARAAWKDAGVRAGYEDLVAFALVRVLKDFASFNAVETEAGIEVRETINVAFAVGLQGGLVAAAVFDMQGMAIPDIVSARRGLIERARGGMLTVREMTGGTISLSNLGLTRVEHFTPLINRPQQAIFGLGHLRRVPAVEEGDAIRVGHALGISLTVDHRVHDGAASGAFLTALVERLEQPGLGPDGATD